MQVRKSRSIAGCLAAVAMFASVCVHATNLVTNGGFETGDFTGWSLFGATGFDGVDDQAPASGTYAAFFGAPTRAPSGISQSLTTIAGQFYTITFALMNEVDPNGLGTPNSFAFNWNGGAAELSLVNVAGPTPYTLYSFTLLATSSLTDLQFAFASDPAFWDFDNVTVSLVPEPGSLALLALGGTMIAAFKRRRRHS